jgi:antitoxin ParD1/3/4
MERFVDAKVRSGEYADAHEVVRAGLRALEKEEREDAVRLEALRAALKAGEESGFVEGDPFEQVEDYLSGLARPEGA